MLKKNQYAFENNNLVALFNRQKSEITKNVKQHISVWNGRLSEINRSCNKLTIETQ